MVDYVEVNKFIEMTEIVPSVDEIIKLIIKSGSGSAAHFGYDLKTDGLHLQQDPIEFAEFIHYISNNIPPSDLSLDIGIASGGQTKFLRDFYVCKRTIIVDLGQHPDAVNWPRIRESLRSDLILELFGDSHTASVRSALMPYRGNFDFAFVDGDHSYIGLRKDIFLVRELLKPGSFIALHDTFEIDECKLVHNEMLSSSNFNHIKDFNNRFGISLWQLVNNIESDENNRNFGTGDI